MKSLFTLLIAFVFACPGFSQVPEKMSYQAVVRNANGELIKSNSVGIQISILLINMVSIYLSIGCLSLARHMAVICARIRRRRRRRIYARN